MKAILYARVSSKEQEKEGYSIPAQVKLLEEYSLKHGLTIIEKFTEAETAKKSGREAFSKMLELLQNSKEPIALLVEKTDRLTRNFKDFIHIDDLISAGKLEVHLLKENDVLTKDSRSQAKFMHGIRLLMAKNYIDNLSEEVKKGMKEKAEQGHWPTVAPYGYKNNRETHLIEIDLDTAPLVQRAFELYVSNEYSLESLREELYQEGFTYRPSTNRIPRNTLEKILKNPIYIGDFVWVGKYYKGKHQPLIPIELFEKVQAIIHNRFKGQTTKRDFQFTGLLTCSLCGHAITAELKKQRYVYYHCANLKCPGRSENIREEELELQFLSLLERLQLDSEWKELVIEALKGHHQVEKEFHENSVSSIQAQLKKLQEKLDKVYEDKLEGIIPEELWFRKHNQYLEEQTRLMRSLDEHQKGSASYMESGIQLIEIAQNAIQLYKKPSNTEKRRLLRFLSSNYTLKDKKVVPDWNPPFSLFYFSDSFEEWRGVRESNPSLIRDRDIF